MDIVNRINELKMEAIQGFIPTWYAYQEIDRLEKLIYNINPILKER